MTTEVEVKLIEKFSERKVRGELRKVIFWYDAESTFSKAISEYKLDQVMILRVDDFSYFQIKYLLEIVYTQKNILLYFNTAKPKGIDNPLLDILLYSEEFEMDSIVSLMNLLAIEEPEIKQIFETYRSFFLQEKLAGVFSSMIQLKSKVEQNDIELGILCVLTNTKELRFSTVLIHLFIEEITKKSAYWRQIEKYQLAPFFWKQVTSFLGYEGEQNIRDLICAIFKTKAFIDFEEQVPRNWQNQRLHQSNNCIVFLSQWMNRKDLNKGYQKCSIEIAKNLRIPSFIKKKAIEFLAKSDSFIDYDDAIISQVAEQLSFGTLHYDRYEKILIDRRNTYWFQERSHEYQLLIEGIRLLRNIQNWQNKVDLKTKEAIWQWYQAEGYEIDACYRRFCTEYQKITIEVPEINTLRNMIEAIYKNEFLMLFGEYWSQFFEKEESFQILATSTQKDFYEEYVASFEKSGHRIFVIISDAFRYECASELTTQLNMEHRFKVSLNGIQGIFPSFTELGMAALLPHQKMMLMDRYIELDGKRTTGIESRRKILEDKIGKGKATAYSGKDLLNLSRMELRELYSGTSINYIYHNTIDSIGDHASSENQVFTAVEMALSELTRLIQKLTVNVNASRLIITADHGFIYSESPLKKIDKIPIQDKEVLVRNRRFILNKVNKNQGNTHTFLIPEFDNQVIYGHTPIGSKRFSIQGGGANFVHGGMMPQEIMIPVLEIKTERGKESYKQVQVQLLSERNKINNIVTYLDFLQIQPVRNNLYQKRVHVYLEDEDNVRISNELLLLADSYSEDAEERIMREKLVLFSQTYHVNANYYLVMVNEQDKSDIHKIRFSIDLTSDSDM
ncbi:BREX-1 system phosphatase PglZ type A [Isobaculum melis]|uniref:TIGR02687 family protein n=1 Tax=Isobaculum melis TaxID=142588 RepID=A0A1H9RMC0_9LACT|nr:BREX-1 system phosphatase PglZ type A [Isobaculum melis]SER73864.1 TIGR02687 family protein [Isobaculum melis]